MKPHSTTPATDRMAQILKRLYLARKARREAKKAMAKYLAEAWGETDGDEDGPGWRDPKAHEFGRCGLGQAGGPYDPEPILCPVCAGSAPFHAAYLRASREAGSALRQAQAWDKRFAERGVADVTNGAQCRMEERDAARREREDYKRRLIEAEDSLAAQHRRADKAEARVAELERELSLAAQRNAALLSDKDAVGAVLRTDSSLAELRGRVAELEVLLRLECATLRTWARESRDGGW